MSYKVLVYSCHSIIQIGLSYCVRKSISNASIVAKSSLIQVFENNLDFDLYVFDISQFTEMSYIIEKFASNLKEQNVVLLIDNIEIEKLINFKDVVYIHKDRSEAEVVKQLRNLCKSKRLKPSCKYKSVTKKMQNKIKFSTREKECANLFMRGYSVSQISKEFSLKLNTISTYKNRIHKKTNTNNLVQLIKTLYELKN
jgi:DNA-binding NarL/FixJ family response regulator